ncbi:MAG: hypothetical protein HYV46_14395 [candidate division NC10 bacterium]|nr:hypothetical protein [candidate division NC10 bacterium]MBI2457315.1 hypothetical protein [candidate division NC10 bacterium]
MARKRLITLLMPLPTLSNPDAKGVRKPIERRKFVQTAREISKHFDGGADLQIFRRDKPHGFWWDRGFLSKDVLAYISADLPDSEKTRAWMRDYAKRRLLKRFRQKAIYWRWLVVEVELVRAPEAVSEEEENEE